MHKTDKSYFVNQVVEKLNHLKLCSLSDSEPLEKYLQISSNQVKQNIEVIKIFLVHFFQIICRNFFFKKNLSAKIFNLKTANTKTLKLIHFFNLWL